MTLQIEPLDVPIRIDEDGVARVGQTRVPIDTIVYQYKKRARPEKIAQRFDTLTVEQVYAVIAYYLQHRDEVDDYIRQREQYAEEWRKRIEEKLPQKHLRQTLLTRRAK